MNKTSVEVGDIFKVYVAYRDNPDQGKERPTVIVQIDEIPFLVLLAPVTGQGPKLDMSYTRHFDDALVPIVSWRKCGLDKPSWAEVDSILPISNISALLGKPYYGKMDKNDLRRIIEKINDLNQ